MTPVDRPQAHVRSGPAGQGVPAHEEVLAAAARLVAAFAASDARRYFACFAPEASFVFHNVAGWLGDRHAYEQLWASWEAGGFRVASCRSLEPQVKLVAADIAVFTHRVRTRRAGGGGELAKRESIGSHRPRDGAWLAVHEHLSPDPVEEIA